MSETNFDVAVIGCGYMGGEHISAIARHGRFRLIAGCDIDPARRAALPEGTRAYESIEPLLKAQKPDLVVLALPSHLHPQAAQRCFEAGCDVLCEKPPGLTIEDCRNLGTAAQAAGVRFWVGGQRKYHATLRAALQCVNEIDARFVTCTFSYNWPAFSGPTWRHDRTRSGGIAIIDTGWHALDYLDYALGLPTSVYCQTVPLAGYPDIDNQAALILNYPNGTIANLVFNYTSPITAFDFAFFEADKSITVTPTHLAHRDAGKLIHEQSAPTAEDPMQRLYDELAAALDGATSPLLTDAPRATRIMSVVQAAYRSAAEKRAVAI